EREQINGVYRDVLAPVALDGTPRLEVFALSHIVERCHPSYAGRLGLAEQACLIRGAHGISGPNLDYLVNTLAHLDELGIQEPELRRLLTTIGGHFARSPTAANGSRPASTA